MVMLLRRSRCRSPSKTSTTIRFVALPERCARCVALETKRKASRKRIIWNLSGLTIFARTGQTRIFRLTE